MKDPIRVTNFTRVLKNLRRHLSRSEWAVWLLGLERTDVHPTASGLILIQIDGLAKTQLETAIDNGRMPFLESLIKNEHYTKHPLYSGLPSSTPSFQGELYYGQRTVVPAFGFRDHQSGRMFRMFANDVARDVERLMRETNGSGLLEGGSSYCNIYGGGAADAHFCATSFGWGEFLKTVNPFRLLLVMLLNVWMFFRVLGLMIIECFLATFDFVRGILSGRQFWQELLMIPARVIVVVLLRELVTIGASYDAARGLPIIHVNFLGYDEQAHRRGPGSRFAHWTLRGIDGAIRRLWKSAHRGAGREYDVWVFSDHGQETTRPYQLAHGITIQQVVADLVQGEDFDLRSHTSPNVSRLPTRASWLGLGSLVTMLFGEQDYDIQARSPHVQTVTSGPLGFIYLLNPKLQVRRNDIAEELVARFDVPMVVQARENNQALVSTADGTYLLPADAVLVFGADHPFLEDVTADLIRLAHHADSGDLVLVGWTHKTESTSFVLQNGAHAGPGIEETRGFALLPSDVSAHVSDRRFLRPEDLRQFAIRFLGRNLDEKYLPALEFPPLQDVRIMTYNVHGCVGMDGQLSPERIARVISQSGANIVCLQELDVYRKRSGHQDQALAIARQLEMNFEFHPAWHVEGEKFGNAILTKFPMRVIQAGGLHHHKADRSRRSALWVEVDINPQTTIQLISTHMSIYPKEQLIQAQQLINEWIEPASQLGPVVLCGDFNARPNSETYKVFARTLFDVESFDDNPVRATLFSPFPLVRVDHMFVTRQFATRKVEILCSRIAKVASDHLPLVVNLKLKSQYQPSDPGSDSLNAGILTREP